MCTGALNQVPHTPSACARSDPQVAVLEQQCAEVTAELRTARKQHEEAVAKLADQHAEEVGDQTDACVVALPCRGACAASALCSAHVRLVLT